MLGSSAAALAAVFTLPLLAPPAASHSVDPGHMHPHAPVTTRATPCPPPRGLLSDRARRTTVGFAIGGAIVFTVFYGGATGFAAAELDSTRHAEDTREVRDRRRVAHLMLVPVFGPFVAAPLGRSRSDRGGLAGFGILQSVGLAMLGTAVFGLARDRRLRRARHLALAGGLTSEGGILTVRGRF